MLTVVVLVMEGQAAGVGAQNSGAKDGTWRRSRSCLLLSSTCSSSSAALLLFCAGSGITPVVQQQQRPERNNCHYSYYILQLLYAINNDQCGGGTGERCFLVDGLA